MYGHKTFTGTKHLRAKNIYGQKTFTGRTRIKLSIINGGNTVNKSDWYKTFPREIEKVCPSVS